MTNRFPPGSRYAAVETTTLTTLDGRTIVYLKRRFLPSPDRFAVLYEHTVREGERMDHIAFQHLGDPEAFWRICDANAAMHPDDLATPERVIRITMPEGIPGGR